MPNETARMYLLAALSTLLLISCSVPNPESCADGKCTDDRFPFCDEDGRVGGKAGACIAVSCSANEFEVCRGDEAITCDASGNNFDVTNCPLGCAPEAGGCRQCMSDAQCANPAPICDDVSSQCRRCTKDDECSSRVCNLGDGTCVPESNVVYASPGGVGNCLQSSPCSLSTAVAAASAAAAMTPTIRMLPGNYVFPLEVSGGSQQPLRIVATGATIVATPAVTISNGANVEIRNLDTIGSRALRCVPGPTSSIAWRDAKITKSDNDGEALSLASCGARLTNVELSLGTGELAFGLPDDSTFEGDRMFIHGSNTHYVFASGARVNFTLTNSLLENVSFVMNTTDSGVSMSRFTMAYVTFVGTAGFGLSPGCSTAQANRTVRWENSFVAPLLGSGDAIDGPGCLLRSVFVSHQATPLLGVSVVDPQFVNPAQNDFHIKSTSPAVNAALPSQVNLDSKIDLDGKPRPAGSASDVGAYEFTP